MTRPSRGISPIQRKARGTKMAKKSGMPTLAKKESLKARVTKRAPIDAMSVGAANSLPMGPAAGMKCGGAAKKGYYKGGSVDGIIKKGHTKGKIC